MMVLEGDAFIVKINGLMSYVRETQLGFFWSILRYLISSQLLSDNQCTLTWCCSAMIIAMQLYRQKCLSRMLPAWHEAWLT